MVILTSLQPLSLNLRTSTGSSLMRARVTSLKSSSARAIAIPRLVRITTMNPTKKMIYSRMSLIVRRFKSLNLEVRTQIYWKRMRLKSCSMLTLRTRKWLGSSRWRITRRAVMTMAKVRSGSDLIPCCSISTRFARRMFYSYSSRSIASHKCWATS